jgi:hypothetical protein
MKYANLIGFILIFISLLILIFVLVLQINSCTSNPLIYAANKYKNDRGAVDVFGTLSLVTPKGYIELLFYDELNATWKNRLSLNPPPINLKK